MRKYDLPFEDRDIINDPLQRQQMIEKSGQMLSPCVEINDHMLADGGEVEAYLLANNLAIPSARLTLPRMHRVLGCLVSPCTFTAFSLGLHLLLETSGCDLLAPLLSGGWLRERMPAGSASSGSFAATPGQALDSFRQSRPYPWLLAAASRQLGRHVAYDDAP
jgi:hypothetical protein